MIGASPPGKERDRSGGKPEAAEKSSDKQILRDLASAVNADPQLLPSQEGVSFFELKENGRTSYQVCCESRSWFFSLRYSAEAKVDRLIRARVRRAA
jgi:hypothetical protein